MAKELVHDAHPDGIPNQKTGTFWTAAIHIFCAIVGAGVLALPHSLAWLGWIAGPICIVFFYLVSVFTSRLLADVYEVNGVEAGRYHIAVNNILGGWYSWGVAVFQLTNIFLIGITYTITAATSLVEIAQVGCDWSGTAPGDCFDSTWKLTVIFGAAEILLSQVKNLESAWWVSSLGVVTSLFYSTVALVLGCRYASARQGTIGGIQANHVNKAFGILSALGAIAFAYSFSLILLEIQDTLHQPPKASKTMKPAVVLAISMSFFFYFVVAVTGYSSLGNSVPGFILTGFPDAPRWVIFVSNIMIMLHMISAYQVFTQPMFDTLESHVKAYNLRRAIARGDTEMPRKAEEAIARASARQVSMTTNPVAAPASRSASQTEAGQDTSGTAASAMGRASSSPAAGRLHRTSAAVSENLRRLSRASSMYHADTGFANTAVPSNDDHFYIPLWQRLILRTFYVVVTTVIAVVMPFFSDMAGLVGALTFFPLSIFFPIRCWRAVYGASGKFNFFLWFLEIFMGFICLAATIASVRGIINNWGSYKIFAD